MNLALGWPPINSERTDRRTANQTGPTHGPAVSGEGAKVSPQDNELGASVPIGWTLTWLPGGDFRVRHHGRAGLCHLLVLLRALRPTDTDGANYLTIVNDRHP